MKQQVQSSSVVLENGSYPTHGVSKTLGLEFFPFTGLIVFSLNALLVKTQSPEKLTCDEFEFTNFD